jgi:hypothetical protein
VQLFEIMNNNNSNNNSDDSTTVVLSHGIVINADGDRMHRVNGRNYIVKRRFVVDNAYIEAKRAQGIIKPVCESIHGWTENQIENYVPTGFQDGIWFAYPTDRYEDLPYGICACCGFYIPKNCCATLLKENGDEVDMCIPCVPGFHPAEY